MSASLIQSLGSGTPSLQEEMVRRFAANLAQNPEARAAFEKATGGNTPASSPAALRALENEQMAAARRANQLAAGREAVAAKKMEQEAFGPRPSGLMQSQVVELPGGGKAVYDREGRLVGTNIPVETGMSAADRADFNRGEGLTSERNALRPAMEEAVRKAMEARVAAQSEAAPVAQPTPPPAFAEALTRGAMAGPASPSTLGEQFLARMLQGRQGPLASAERPPAPQAPLPADVSNLLFGEEPFAAAADQERRDNAARARTSARISEIMRGAQGAPKKQEADVASSLFGRGLVPEVQQGLFSSALGLYDLYNNLLARPLDRALFGIPIPETPSSAMEEYQRSLGRPTGWTGGL